MPDPDPWDDGEGFDIYIDAARYLPDNVTASMVIGNVFSRRWEPVLTSSNIVSEVNLATPAFSPVYASRTEFRAESFDPTLTLVVKIVTVERETGRLKVGFLFFLFWCV